MLQVGMVKQIARMFSQLAGVSHREKGIKPVHIPKQEIVKYSFELAAQLNIRLPKTFSRLSYDDVFLIKWQLDYELNLKNIEKDGCEVIFEPPRKPSSEIIAAMIEKAKAHKLSNWKHTPL